MVLTSEQVRVVEASSVELGMSWLRLMENAGSAAAKIIRDKVELRNKRTVIVCGKGNNGGDGYVIARKLSENGAQVRIVSVGSPSTPSSVEMASKAYGLGLRPIDFESYTDLCRQHIEEADILIDSVFGTGFKGQPSGMYKTVIDICNSSSAYKIAVDVPSGMSSDAYDSESCFVKADLTVTFAAYKPCHLLFPTSKDCGEVTVASIGMPDAAFERVTPVLSVVSDSFAASLLPKRHKNFHKGDCGTAALYCGAKGYSGAAVIAVKAAVKSGAGIVNAVIPDAIYGIVATSVPEAICTVLPDVAPKDTDSAASNTVISTLNKSTVALIGCGLGTSSFAESTVKRIMTECNIPLVIDADGINLLSDSIDLIRQYPKSTVITPHPKEASRLLKCTVAEIQNDRLGSARKLAEITGAVSVLKGAGTVIATPKGRHFIVTDGNPGMATAGTGDMLAGMTAAFISQGLSTEDAAVAAVKLHALAGDTAVKTTSQLALTPTDMINSLPEVFCRINGK